MRWSDIPNAPPLCYVCGGGQAEENEEIVSVPGIEGEWMHVEGCQYRFENGEVE